MPLRPALGRIASPREALLTLVAGDSPWTSVVRDGPFGHHNALQMAPQRPLHLLSTLRCDAALSWPSTGPSAGRGPPRTEGDKLEDTSIPAPYLPATTVEGHLPTCLSQAPLLHQACAPAWNVVSIGKTNRHPHPRGPVTLFRSDQAISDDTRRDSYGRRFQREFHVRDAKQYGGLEDFMPVTPPGVPKAAHLALFMVNVADRLRAALHPYDPDESVLDLNADGRGYQYVPETIQLLPA